MRKWIVHTIMLWWNLKKIRSPNHMLLDFVGKLFINLSYAKESKEREKEEKRKK